MAPTYKLTYFDFTAVGEPIRFILSYLGVDFEDIRIPLKEWPQHKETLPFGKVPMLEIDGKKVHQSLAICRYLAKQTDLTGNDDWENLLIDMVVETFVDFRLQVARMMHETGDAKIQLLEKLKSEIVPFYMEKFDEMVKENNGYFVNGHLTWADIYVTAFSFTLQSVLGEDVYEKYPNMAELRQKVNDVPQIKAWIEKRPPSDL